MIMKASMQLDSRTPASQTNGAAGPQDMSGRTLIAFLVIAFGLSWGLMAFYMLFPEQITAIFGEVGYTNPLFILAVYAPAIAGIFLVARTYKLRGLVSYLRRLALWRMPFVWWAFLIAGIPAVNYLGAAISGPIADPFPFSPWYAVLPALAAALLIGPMEEFGWRGVALPLFQRRFAPLWAGLILGLIWGLWHVPSFFMDGTPQSAWQLGPYFVGVVAIAVILTPMFNVSRGSILIPILYHFQMNNPIWPDAQPWSSYIFAVIAVAVVLLNRKAMLNRSAAVTGVLEKSEHRSR
jgi:uncharacterized protein